MSINSSSSFNVTLPLISSFNSSITLFCACQHSIASDVIYTIHTFINILLLLPLYILILYRGFQRWRMTMSHFDFFTYNMMILEIFGVFGSVFYTMGNYTSSMIMLECASYLFGITFSGHTLFHVLTCLERYLAVVHPLTYMRLRETVGVRIRNTSTVCTWLLCFGWIVIMNPRIPSFPVIPFLSSLGVSILLIFFCCLSVLHVLTRPGPGQADRHKERVDQSKQRAFHMITATLGVLLLRFVGLLLCFGIKHLFLIELNNWCVLLHSGILLTMPSSLVLPLLFLQRAGRLSCCRKKTQSA